MTELMKENKLAKSIDDMCNAFEESQQEVGRLERENSQLKAQLTWRPVAQKPDVDGLYVVTKRDESPRWDKSYHLVRFKNSEWKVDSFSGGYVYSYFNVPIPEPNRE